VFPVRARRQASSQVPPRERPSRRLTIKVVIAPDGFMPRASLSTAENCAPRRYPAMAFIDVCSERRAAISTTEIGVGVPATLKSRKSATPIMWAMSLNGGGERGHFRHPVILAG